MRAIFVGCFEPTCFDFEFHDILKYIKQKKNIPSNTTRATSQNHSTIKVSPNEFVTK